MLSFEERIEALETLVSDLEASFDDLYEKLKGGSQIPPSNPPESLPIDLPIAKEQSLVPVPERPLPNESTACPNWSNSADWSEACGIASQIEAAPIDGPCHGSLEERAHHIAVIFDEDKCGSLSVAQVRETFAYLLKNWPVDREVAQVLRDLRRYPDGVLPSAFGDGTSRPSRLERIYRKKLAAKGGRK